MSVIPTPRRDRGWAALFRDAFRRSQNPMVLSDDQRVIIEVNTAFAQLIGRSPGSLARRPLADLIVDGPILTLAEWRAAMAREEITGEAELLGAGGRAVAVQYAAYPEVVTGRRLVLFVALEVSRWGRHFRREAEEEPAPRGLSERELEVIRMISLGATGPEIAAELRLSHNTVRTHVANAMTRLGARSRAHLVAKVLGDGIALP
ncbi:MAG: helix-turn-helix transcriptional regulator [Thermoleophilaceae bacterium]